MAPLLNVDPDSSGMVDITLALSYLELSANSMGLGTCWAGLLHAAMLESEAVAEVLPIV